MLKTSNKSLFFLFFFVLIFSFFCSKNKIEYTKNKKVIIKKINKSVKITEKKGIVKKGDTIINILKNRGLDYSSAFKLFSDVKPVFDLRKLKVGKAYSFFFQKQEFKGFKYQIDDNSFLYITNMEKKYKGIIKTIPYVIKRVVVSGKIKSSLFNSILSEGENPELADLMASLYEYDIDFNRDLRVGDKYSLLIEKKYLNGVFKAYGKIIVADFTRSGNSVKVVLYENPEGKTAYYHPDGRAVKKMFLRSPLPFMRVTSRFGMRKHPILGFSSKHNGVDLAAPRGTRVKVTASGVVIKSGYNRIKGRYVEVRHPNKYITQYFHLSGIKSGIRRGKRVVQGELIGYVGNTGRSTGPHLHYGVKKGKSYINPLRLKSPKKNPVNKKYLKKFIEYSKSKISLLYDNSKKVSLDKKFIMSLESVIKPITNFVGI